LYNEIIKGFDIVYTVSSKRNDFIDEITSQFFWFVLIKLFKVNMIRNQLMLKIFTKEFAEIFSLYYERNRTIGGLAFDISSNYHIIEVDNRKRTIGRSHYNFFKRFNIMIDMVINLSNTPVNMMIHLGWITFTGTLIVSFYELYSYFFRQVPSGYTSLILSIFFFGSLIVMLLGIIGRYLSNINLEVKQRPLFHIKSKYNL
jgi:hypothetical protein